MEGVSTKISGDPWDQAWANIRHGRSTWERKPGTDLCPMMERFASATKATTIRLMNVCQSTPSRA
jgi:hypothetical protein